jgi:transcriptional regulator with XRE-family HTH domain
MKRQRRTLGLRQEDVADAVGRSRATVAAWETGRQLPEAEVLPSLAGILQVSIEALLATPAPPSPPAPQPAQGRAS